MQPSVKFFCKSSSDSATQTLPTAIYGRYRYRGGGRHRRLNADHVGRTSFSNGNTGRQDDKVTGFNEVIVEGCKDSIVDNSVRINGFFTVKWPERPS